MEEDPLTLDLKFDWIEKLQSITIEGLGVYAYRANITDEQLLLAMTPTEIKYGFGRGFVPKVPFIGKKNDDKLKSIGIIVNIKMENSQQKKISFES